MAQMDPEIDLMDKNSSEDRMPDAELGEKKTPNRKDKFRALLKGYWWLIVFPLFAIVVLYIGGYTGFQKGLVDRTNAETRDEAKSLLEQFNLGVEDLTAGRFDLARQRAVYILSVDPDNEAAIGLLDLALEALNRPTLTPTLEITPTITTPSPTPDLSSIESTFNEANAHPT